MTLRQQITALSNFLGESEATIIASLNLVQMIKDRRSLLEKVALLESQLESARGRINSQAIKLGHYKRKQKAAGESGRQP